MSPLLPTIHEAFRGSRCEHNTQQQTTTQTEKNLREAEEKAEEGKGYIV